MAAFSTEIINTLSRIDTSSFLYSPVAEEKSFDRPIVGNLLKLWDSMKDKAEIL